MHADLVQRVFGEAAAGAPVSSDQLAAAEPGLRLDLVNLQEDLRQAGFSVLLLVVGDDRPACEDWIDRLHAWMDARQIETHVFERPTLEEAQRPRFWRYWRALPRRGRIAIHLGAWAQGALADVLAGRIDETGLERRLEHIRRLEQTLLEDGVLLLKFWMHRTRAEHRARLREARRSKRHGWELDDIDRSIFEHHGALTARAAQLIEATSTPLAPWHVVASGDERRRDLHATTILRDALRAAIERGRPTAPQAVTLPPPPVHGAALDVPARTAPADHAERLDRLQRKLHRRQRRARKAGVGAVLVFEGWDAAGKGGTIRRITNALHARDYQVVPIGAPGPEEKEHHWLWRFWRHVPRAGRMVIFDRSWYGRVLVERVEGFASEPEWQRAYAEIRDFEDQLVSAGRPVLKFWLQIDPEEQWARFQARAHTPYKKYKLTPEDLRNRARRPDYEPAIEEMIARTSTDAAPWHVIAANDKRAARLEVLQIVCKALRRARKAARR